MYYCTYTIVETDLADRLEWTPGDIQPGLLFDHALDERGVKWEIFNFSARNKDEARIIAYGKAFMSGFCINTTIGQFKFR